MFFLQTPGFYSHIITTLLLVSPLQHWRGKASIHISEFTHSLPLPPPPSCVISISYPPDQRICHPFLHSCIIIIQIHSGSDHSIRIPHLALTRPQHIFPSHQSLCFPQTLSPGVGLHFYLTCTHWVYSAVVVTPGDPNHFLPHPFLPNQFLHALLAPQHSL